MKIEFEREPKIPFEDVAIGEVFEYDCNIYMKIDSTDENEVELDVNAVNLSTGELRHLLSYTDVEVVEAVLTIKDEPARIKVEEVVTIK